MIKDLGPVGELGTVLIGMMTRYRYAKPESMECQYLKGSVSVLGQLKEARAVPQLLQLAVDRKAHENARAIATRSVGRIDAEGSKNFLLRILNASREYHQVRIYAAEGLARTDDPQTLAALNRHALAEKAAREIKARISGKR
jgi:HEAT repeat protein